MTLFSALIPGNPRNQREEDTLRAMRLVALYANAVKSGQAESESAERLREEAKQLLAPPIPLPPPTKRAN